MIPKTIRLIVSVTCLLSFSLSVQAQEASVLEEIKRTGVLKVAVREDAVPFGYRDVNNNLSGLCLDLINLLRQQIKTELNQNILSIKLFKSTLSNRFELVEKNIVYLECGPNTISNQLEYKIEFSAPWFVTGTQFLIRQQEGEKKIDVNGSGKNLIIGVLRNTTTQELIVSKYPSATIREFQGVTGRRRGIQALQGGRIDAFASDGILLIGEALFQRLSIGRDYLLVPQSPLTCDSYGLILPQNDSQWRNLVNSIIQSPQSKQIFQEWFGELLPTIEATIDFCSRS